MADATARLCSIDECGRPVNARGYCRTHYLRDLKGIVGGPIEPRTPCVGQTCQVDDCEKAVCNAGLCRTHYGRWRVSGDVGGDVRPYFPRSGMTCVVDGCEKPRHGREWCAMHYSRWCRDGEVGPPGWKKAQDGEGCVGPDGYRRMYDKAKRRFVAEHRTVMEATLGRPLRDFENVHHKNGIRHDNSSANLELWAVSQPYGQRAVDLAAWVVDTYPDLVLALAEGRIPTSADM